MYGGDAREERRRVIQRALGFASLEWVTHRHPRLRASLCERAARGSVDLVLVNRFVSHADTAALLRVARVPVILLRRGYGVTEIRRVLHAAAGSRRSK